MEELNPLILYSCSVNPQQTNEQRPGIPVTEFIGDTFQLQGERDSWTAIQGFRDRDRYSVCVWG